MPPGYEGKYYFEVGYNFDARVIIVAPRDLELDDISTAPRERTVFFFGKALVYGLPGPSVEEVESDLYSRLESRGYLPATGDPVVEATVELSVQGEPVEAVRVEEISALGRIVRYRIPIPRGAGQVLVALGPAEHFDHQALRFMLEVEPDPEEYSTAQRVAGFVLLIALAVYGGWRMVRYLRAR